MGIRQRRNRTRNSGSAMRPIMGRKIVGINFVILQWTKIDVNCV